MFTDSNDYFFADDSQKLLQGANWTIDMEASDLFLLGLGHSFRRDLSVLDTFWLGFGVSGIGRFILIHGPVIRMERHLSNS